MPNWKKIALSGSSPEFSSLDVDNSISAGSLTGSINFNNLTDSPTLLSSSVQIASDISGSFTSTSASIASNIASLITDSGSFSTRVTAVEGFSSSIESSIYSYTGSFTGVASLSTLSIVNTTTADSLLITTTEDSSAAAPVITLKRNSNSPADADYIGQIKFKGENDADQEVVLSLIHI